MTPEACQNVSFLGVQWPTAVLGAVAGALATVLFKRFEISPKDRHDVRQERWKTSNDLLSEQVSKRTAFEVAVAKAVKKTKLSATDVAQVMTTGDDYIDTMRGLAQAVLDDRVSESSRGDCLSKIADALEKTIPAYYAALDKVCRKTKLSYSGTFTEKNYGSLFKALDRYDAAAATRARQKLPPA